MIEVQILIPTEDNNKVRFLPTHHDAFEAELIRLFGGYSQFPGVVAGGWGHAGTVYHDATLVYAVSVPGIIAAGDALREMADFAKAHYQQLNVYIRYLGVSEIL
jgi:hypothetical protein